MNNLLYLLRLLLLVKVLVFEDWKTVFIEGVWYHDVARLIATIDKV